jgi:hypothetical protein
MRESAQRATRHLRNVFVTPAQMDNLDGPYDLVTMVAVLHHMDTVQALTQVRRLLAPNGKFLVVGLGPPHSRTDLAWELASAVTSPIIGLVKHPRPVTAGPTEPSFPVRNPEVPIDDLRPLFDTHMAGTIIRRRLFFRFTAEWSKLPEDPKH